MTLLGRLLVGAVWLFAGPLIRRTTAYQRAVEFLARKLGLEEAR